jgi:hypothetical protein
METTFFMVYVEGENMPVVKHNTQEEADREAQRLASKYKKEAYVLESIILAEPRDINLTVNSYEAACEYLGYEKDYTIRSYSSKHNIAISALFKLVTIAEAWNEADNFIPDFSDTNQYKYFPWFVYSGASAGFVPAATTNAASLTSTYFGSRLCFKTHERAEQFGKQFCELWNDFLLIK